MGILARLFGGSLKAEVEKCIHSVGTATWMHLMAKYSPEFGEDTASALASAVANELFGAPPGNEFGRNFLASNRELVDAQLRALRREPQICQIVSMLAMTKCNMAGGTASVTPEMILWTVKLRDIGILLPAEQVQLPSSPEEMRRQVGKFFLWELESRDKIRP